MKTYKLADDSPGWTTAGPCPDVVPRCRLDHLPASMLFRRWPDIEPFLPVLAKAGGTTVKSLTADIINGAVRLHFMCDAEAGDEVMAIIGTQLMMRGDTLIGKICWCAGKDRAAWLDLLTELEEHLRRQGCKAVKIEGRRGWTKDLQRRGYALTRVIWEREL